MLNLNLKIRGFDFGNHFCEWMFNNNYDKHPYFQYNPELYPTKEQQINFLSAYLNQFKETIEEKRKSSRYDTIEEESDNEENNKENKSYLRSKNLDLEHLLIEANYFALASHVFWTFWSICQASVCKIKFEYLVN